MQASAAATPTSPKEARPPLVPAPLVEHIELSFVATRVSSREADDDETGLAGATSPAAGSGGTGTGGVRATGGTVTTGATPTGLAEPLRSGARADGFAVEAPPLPLPLSPAGLDGFIPGARPHVLEVPW